MVSDRLLTAALLALTACATVVTAAVVRREFLSAAPATAARKPLHVGNWRAYASEGRVLGPPDAPVTIVEFSDFQCPYCKVLYRSLKAVRVRYPGKVRVVYREYPLEGLHAHAFEAAVAAECAGTQGRFEALHDLLFEKQDSIGLLSWATLAHRSRIPDARAFSRCLTDSAATWRVRADIAAGRRLGVRGTPTVLLNDLLLPGTPTELQLDSLTRQGISHTVR
jgi:protein-disulfide isomerase